MITVSLYTLAHGRSGDKGDACNIGVIARKPEWYGFLRDALTAERVAAFLASIAKGPVERFELENLGALNFLVHGALGGGGSATLQLDAQGKTYAHALLRMPVEVPAALADEARAFWGGTLPPEAAQFVALGADGKPGGARQVEVTVEKRLMHIRFNRPERRNALSLDMIRQIREAAEQAARDADVKVVMMSGVGAGYCAGMDLKEFHRDFSYAGVKAIATELARMLAALLEIPQPLVAAIHGDALGGGTALTLVADCVFAHRAARFGFPEVKIGFVPGLVSALAMRRVPASAARELMLSGRRVLAPEAFRQGWVHHLDESAEAADIVFPAEAYCREMIETNSDAAMRRSKVLIGSRETPALIAEMFGVVELFASYTQEESFKRGVEAFVSKKPLEWGGM